MKVVDILKKNKVLLVDDIPHSLPEVIREKTGREVIVAKDIREAARILEEKSQEIEFALAGMVWSLEEEKIHWISPAGVECICDKWHLLKDKKTRDARAQQGILILNWVKKNYPEIRTIALTSMSSEGEEAIDGGAENFTPKESFCEESDE